MTELSLGQAAKAVGKSKSTITRAIKSGKLSAQRRDNGSYSIDPSELFRVWNATVAQPVDAEPSTEPHETASEVLMVKVEMLENQLLREQETVDDLRRRLDSADERVLQLTHKEPSGGGVTGFMRRLWGR